MINKCELCGDEYHEGWDTRMDQFKLVCPGANASQLDRDVYIQAIGAAYLGLITEVEHYKDTIEDRKRLWYQRERSEVSQEALQADCDTRVEEVAERVPLEPAEFIIELPEIDPPHITVQGEVPKRPGLVQVHEKDRTEPEDAQLFVDPPQGPPLVNEPPYGPDFHPLDGYWHK